MRGKGFAGGPFQLLIGIVVFGMALLIGAYLFNMINCWKCEELLKIETIELKEAIASVGKGDVNSKKNDVVELEPCAEGIYLKQLTDDDGGKCRSFCPNHPNNCWVIIANSRCSGGTIIRECIDINGNMVINSFLPQMEAPDDPWLNGAYPFSLRSTFVSIEKTGVNEMEIGKP